MADLRLAALILGAVFAGACRQDMHDQPRYEPLQKSDFFPDGRASRPLVAGTVARETSLGSSAPQEDSFTDVLPFPVTKDTLHRGRERYDIHCSPCHGRTGEGQGMIVRRGFKAPPSLHDARSRALPVGYLYSVIANGYGAMPSYADAITANDRWAIAAYVRVLQFSRNAPAAALAGTDHDMLGRAQ